MSPPAARAGSGDDDRLRDWFVELYCEAGTALWRRMVGEGRLRGQDVLASRGARLIDVVAEVAVAAEHDGDVELIAMWYALGHATLVGGTLLDVEDLERDPLAPLVNDGFWPTFRERS